MITDTLWMMGRLKIYFHFSSENPLILIVTHLKSTCVGTVVEVCAENCGPEGCFFCFLLLRKSDVLSRLLLSLEDFWLVLLEVVGVLAVGLAQSILPRALLIGRFHSYSKILY